MKQAVSRQTSIHSSAIASGGSRLEVAFSMTPRVQFISTVEDIQTSVV